MEREQGSLSTNQERRHTLFLSLPFPSRRGVWAQSKARTAPHLPQTKVSGWTSPSAEVTFLSPKPIVKRIFGGHNPNVHCPIPPDPVVRQHLLVGDTGRERSSSLLQRPLGSLQPGLRPHEPFLRGKEGFSPPAPASYLTSSNSSTRREKFLENS